jgi:hypothetical protein
MFFLIVDTFFISFKHVPGAKLHEKPDYRVRLAVGQPQRHIKSRL